MNKREQVKTIANKAIAYAKSKGAETAVVHVSLSTDFDAEVRNGETENLSEADSHTINMTLSRNQKRASVSSCDFDVIEDLVDQALLLCKYTDTDPYYTLPHESDMAHEIRDLDLYDESILHTEPQKWIETIRALEEKTLAIDSRMMSDGCSINAASSCFALANSLGFCEAVETTSISMGVSVFAEDQTAETGLNKGRKQSAAEGTCACYVEDMESLDALANRASRSILRKLGSRKPKTGRFPVYFEPAMARKLWSALLSGINGSLVYRQETYLADKLGKQIGSSEIYLLEDPFVLRGLSSRPFDAEGVQTRKRDLVKDGILNTFLLNTYSANKLKMKTTGHSGGCGNIFVQPGALGEREMLKQMGTGLWLTELSGQGVKMTTGDYSRGASGLWVENGDVVYPVSEFTLSSNLHNMFNGIKAIGNNVEEKRPIITPGVVIAEMTLSGTN
ncbi:MAG: hypothetical protein CR997_07470 [Acidobacteria bacterium]|nr:MAG: hypothetical protein CR997_07470 [Acidobacteriota bacterium]